MTDPIVLPGGVEIELVERDGRFVGLGEVRLGPTVLRTARRGMFVDIRSPYGIELCDFVLKDRRETDAGVCLSFAMSRRDGGPMEWQIHECRRYHNTADWSAEPAPADALLELEIGPVRRTIGEDEYAGFRYQYRYRSADVPIYVLLDRGTWAPGGSAVGCEFWMRSTFAPPIYRARSAEEHYSTEWYLEECANPNIFQFLPLQTQMQGFTMTACEAGILLTWATEVAHIRSLFEKPRGADEFVHLHEHCGDLAGELVTSPVEVLFSPGARDRVGRANAHGDMTDLVYETLHEQIGFRRERVETRGMIEEWPDADLDLYRTEGLGALLETGVKCIELANHFENNMNVYGVSNMCCTVDYKVADSVGAEKLRAFCDAARAGGAKVEMWANTSISTLTVLLAQRHGRPKRIDFLPEEDSIMAALQGAAEPFVRNTFGGIEADHYTPVFAVLNLRDPAVREYWMSRWRDAHDRVGLEGIFLDSSFNLSSDKFHYRFNAPGAGRGATADQTDRLGGMRPASRPPGQILSQYRAHLDLMAEMQRAGYTYCNEDGGVFGIHRHGPSIEKRLDNLPLWPEHIASFDAPAIRAAGGDPDDVFFAGLAYRMVWLIYWHVPSRELTFRYTGAAGDEDRPTPWHLALLRAFNEVGELMTRRKILPGEAGVVYRHEGKLVLWAMQDLELPLEGARTVRDVQAGTEETSGAVRAARHGVYVVS